MPNNQFKKGELYSFITGKAQRPLPGGCRKILNKLEWKLRLNNGVYYIIYGKRMDKASSNYAMLLSGTSQASQDW